MEDNYLRQMQRYENEYQDYLRKADQILEENGKKHSKDECVFLQKAAESQSKMANISIGEEKLYHQRKIRELNQKILAIVKEIDPEAYARWINKKQYTPALKNSAETGKQKTEETEDEIDTEGWFAKPPRHSFADVAGMDDLKQYLQEAASNTGTGELKKYLNQPNLSSFFFYGPPGCGKTYLIEAFIHELMQKDYKYLTLDGSNILSKYVGEAEKIVTKLFAKAEESAPCIVFIDEIDGVCKNRSLPNLPEYASSITTSFLMGYNRIQTTEKPIIFIGATNFPGQVDNAMLDRVELIRISLPDRKHRTFIFEHQLQKKVKLDESLNWEYMAACTEGYDIRDIKRLINRMLYMISKELMTVYHDEARAVSALESGEYVLTKKLFDEAVSENRPTPKEGILKGLDAWENMMRSKQGIESLEQDMEEFPEEDGNDYSARIEGLTEHVEELSDQIAELTKVLRSLDFSGLAVPKDPGNTKEKPFEKKKLNNKIPEDISLEDLLNLELD